MIIESVGVASLVALVGSLLPLVGKWLKESMHAKRERSFEISIVLGDGTKVVLKYDPKSASSLDAEKLVSILATKLPDKVQVNEEAPGGNRQ